MTRFLPLFIIALILLVQFLFSSQQGIASHGISTGITNEIIEKLAPLAQHIRDSPKWMLEDELNSLIRKAAHFSLFFLLGISLPVVLKLYLPFLKKPLVYLLTLAGIVLLACLDEVHQAFIPGRDANFIDVAIDTVGTLFAFLCTGLHFLLKLLSNFIYYHFQDHTESMTIESDRQKKHHK